MADDTEIDEGTEENSELNLHNGGEMLRRAREQKSLSVEDIAKTTRIPQRHLSSIESGDYGALPGRTYAIGFAKSYARAVGLSEATIGGMLREEMDEQGHGAYQPETSGYAPSNPTSIPPKSLAWTAAGIGALLLVGYLVWRTLFLGTGDIAFDGTETEVADPAATQQVTDAETQTGTTSDIPSDGTVVLTATEKVWLKIYDASGERLFEKEMDVGEKYTVPTNADNPQILTGRPDALTVAINDKVVPALGTGEFTIKDVGISAAALLARGEPGGDNTGGNLSAE